MNVIRRILQFDKQDWKHLRFLSSNLLTQLFNKYDWHETKDTYYWIKIHLMYDSTKVE